jgi:hypothetical protein
MEKERKRKIISIRISETQLFNLKNAIAEEKKTMSDFLRTLFENHKKICRSRTGINLNCFTDEN